MRDVRWALNFDLRAFDDVWSWLHTLPPSPARSRAIGAAAMLGVAELDRPELAPEAVAAFDDAIAAFPDDARLPLWRAYVQHLQLRAAGADAAALASSFAALREAGTEYPSFTLFGFTLAVGGHADASRELVDEAQAALAHVVEDTTAMQTERRASDRARTRRIFDTPLAPYNVPAMQAMIGDLALRQGKPAEAARAYYTAVRTNAAARWPWRAEVQRRLDDLQGTQAAFAAKTEVSFGSASRGAMAVPEVRRDERFGGRIGNGSCTVCHTHVSIFDEGAAPAEVGWIRGRFKSPRGVPNALPLGFALPDGKDPIPTGFAIGPWVDTEAGDDFDTRDALYSNEFYVPAAPGRWFVALQASVDGQAYQGYGAQGLGAQWFVDVKAGTVADLTSAPIELTKQ